MQHKALSHPFISMVRTTPEKLTKESAVIRSAASLEGRGCRAWCPGLLGAGLPTTAVNIFSKLADRLKAGLQRGFRPFLLESRL